MELERLSLRIISLHICLHVPTPHNIRVNASLRRWTLLSWLCATPLSLVFILKQCFFDDFQDYGTFGVWGALLAGGQTVVSNKTFRQIQIQIQIQFFRRILILNLYSYFTSTHKSTFFQHYVFMPRNYPFQF